MRRDAHSTTSRETAVTIRDARHHDVCRVSTARFQTLLDYLRDAYQNKEDGTPVAQAVIMNELFTPAGMELIGVATVYLSGLAHGVSFEATPTIVTQEGSMAGQLAVTVIAAPQPERGLSVPQLERATPLRLGDVLRLSVSISEARGVPYRLSTHVSALFSFHDQPEVTVREMEHQGTMGGLSRHPSSTGATISLDTVDDGVFELKVTDGLLAYLANDGLAIQVCQRAGVRPESSSTPTSHSQCVRADRLGRVQVKITVKFTI